MVRPIVAPASAGAIIGRPTPSLRSRQGITVVTSVEEVATLAVSSTLTPQVLQCIPSTLTTWLRGVAANWSKWHWTVLKYIYVPTCPTSTTGSMHMGFLYDSTDSVPTTVAQMATLQGYVTGPVWSGSEGATLLDSLNPSKPCPPGGVCTQLDVNRSTQYWYPYVTAAELTTELTVSSSLGNMRSPARLALATADGSGTTAVNCGRLYAVYRVELIEPIASALNL